MFLVSIAWSAVDSFIRVSDENTVLSFLSSFVYVFVVFAPNIVDHVRVFCLLVMLLSIFPRTPRSIKVGG